MPQWSTQILDHVEKGPRLKIEQKMQGRKTHPVSRTLKIFDKLGTYLHYLLPIEHFFLLV